MLICYFCVNIIYMKILFLFLFSNFYVTAQNLYFEKVGVKLAKYDVFWGNDISGNHYFSTNNNLYKINEKDTLNYTNNKFGKITGVETFNMLQTLVFYKQNNAFVLLDAQFNEINSFIFLEINCEILKPASQNELWFYDGISQKMGLYNLNSKKYRFLTNSLNLKIKHCFFDYNNLYLVDEDFNYFSLNKFGKLTNKIKINAFDQMCFLNKDEFVFVFNKEVFYVNNSQSLIILLDIQEKLIEKVFFKDGILSIFTNYQLSTYQIKK